MADGAKKTVTMNVDKDSLWAVISDYENYPKFVQGLESCEVIDRKGNTVRCQYELNMMMKRVSYVLKHVEKPGVSLKWSMESGEFFKSNDGGWEIKELGPDELEVTYTVSVGLPLLVPKSVVNTLVGSTLPAMLEAFEKEAKAIAKKAKAKTPKPEKAAPKKKK